MNTKTCLLVMGSILLLGLTLGAQENPKIVRADQSNPCPPVASEPAMTPEQLLANLENELFSGEPYDFNFQKTSLIDVIRFIGRVAGVRFAFADAVAGATVTCKFTQTPWDKALSVFLKVNHLWLYPVTHNGVTYLFVNCR